MLLILKHELLKPDAKYAIWHIFNYLLVCESVGLSKRSRGARVLISEFYCVLQQSHA